MSDYKNKLFLIGINFVNEKGVLIEQYQTSGIVVEVKKNYIKLKKIMKVIILFQMIIIQLKKPIKVFIEKGL